MGTFTIRHTFDVPKETFWNETFLNADFNRKLYIEKLEFTGYEVLKEQPKDGGKLDREVRTTPKAEVPKALQKVVGGEIAYVEAGHFDGEHYRFTITPNKLADKMKIRGDMWCEARGETRCERILEMTVEVKIFGVGGVMASFIEKTTRDSYDKSADFTREWLRKL